MPDSIHNLFLEVDRALAVESWQFFILSIFSELATGFASLHLKFSLECIIVIQSKVNHMTTFVITASEDVAIARGHIQEEFIVDGVLLI